MTCLSADFPSDTALFAPCSPPRKPKHHVAKSWPHFFQAIKAGMKTHDLRMNDRDYAVGDTMMLQEYEPFGLGYTGNEVLVEITFMTSNDTPCAISSAVLNRSACVLSIRLIGSSAAKLNS